MSDQKIAAVMVFEALHRLGSKAERVLLYPYDWEIDADHLDDRNSQLLMIANLYYNVRLKPVPLLNDKGVAEPGTLNEP